MARAWGTRLAVAVLAFVLLGLPQAAGAGGPRQHYVLHCQGCHGPEGRGAPGAVPSLASGMGRFLLVPGGRAYLVQVPGAAHAPLDDAELAALLNWMLAVFAAGEIAGEIRPFEAAEVARYRAERPADAAALRRELLARLAGGGPAAGPPSPP